MDYLILYNPLSKSGGSKKKINKIKRKLQKKGNTVTVGSFLDIVDVKEFIDKLNPTTKILVIGGDGTLHHLANTLIDYEVKNDVYAMSAGTGNDFVRSLKSKEKLVRINDYICDIPYDLAEENNNQRRYFINSVGIGVDAYIAYLVNTLENSKGRWSYFKSTYRGFTKYKPADLTITIDGEEKQFKKVWLTVVANSAYLGKGMKISPKSVRLDDKLEIIVVHGMPRLLLLLIFPLIYLGWHLRIKRFVKHYEGKEIKINSETDKYVQYDGETEYPRRKLHIYR